MPRPNHPNVIVFFTDQQRHDTTGLAGNPLGLTPTFDAFARRGTFVANSFTCQPVCGPARACLQTGRYPTQTGNWRNALALDPRHQTLAHHFTAAGYDTAYIGKWHLADTLGHVPLRQRGGYDYWLASNILEFTSDAYNNTVYDSRNRAVFLPGYRVDALTDAAIRYLATRTQHPAPRLYGQGQLAPADNRPVPTKNPGSPFFLFLSFIEPHHENLRDDYPAPNLYADRYAGRYTPPDLAALGGTAQRHLPGYYGQIKRLDECFARLLDALQSLHLLDNTVILFTSDHGNHFKTRNSEYKRSCHEASIHVPTALSGPGFTAGGQLPHLVSLIDLPPTLLDAAGIPIPQSMQGHSILPIVKNKSARWQDEVFIQISESQVGRALRTPRWKYSVSAPNLSGWDHSHAPHYVEEFLYDIQSDPWELNNMVTYKSSAPILATLRQRLLARIKQAGEPPATISPHPQSQS